MNSVARYSMLERLAGLPNDINVVIAGAGAMGKGLLYQSLVTPGFRCVAIADIAVEKAASAAQSLNLDYRIVENLSALEEAVDRGILAIAEDAELIARIDGADVFIDSTSAIEDAGRFCVTALEHGKHLAMMNAEADLAFGPFFMQLAHANGVTYASIDGDQHGVIKHLVDDLRLWGFDLVMAGNIKGYLDRYANPVSIIPEADKRNLDYKMCTAYTDGTKLCIEMALLANALGLKTAVRGMIGPRAGHVCDALTLFDLEAIYREHGPVVDYLLGAQPDGGVFAIGYSDHPYQRQMMRYYKMGDGPFYVFYRPYHLCHVEAMEAIAEAYLDGCSLLEPRAGFQTDVFAYAKKDLTTGERLDGIGGHTCYGLIESCESSGELGLPMTLAEDVILRRDIAKDNRIALRDVIIDPNRLDVRLYETAAGIKAEAA